MKDRLRLRQKFVTGFLAGMVCFFPVIASAKPPQSRCAKVTGMVTYLQRLALPPTAVVDVKLLDVSLQDAPARLLGEQIITNPGHQVPIPFEIAYDPAAIDPRHTYAVQARITARGRLIFISTSAYHVITRGNPNHVEVIVDRVDKTHPPETCAPKVKRQI
jgi:putative lipoprotein